MYLSCVELNLRNKQARKDVANPYEMHRTLSRVLSNETQPQRFLWRLDKSKQVVLLIQSKQVPDWKLFDPSYLSQIQTPKVLSYWEKLEVSQTFRFRLKANPTVTRDNKRIGLLGLEEQLQWLHRQASKQGFQLIGAMVSENQLEKYNKPNQEKSISVHTVVFDGHLKTTDLGLFCKALQSGIGPAKSFGCGLLTLAKA